MQDMAPIMTTFGPNRLHSWVNARAFCTVGSYLQTGRKQGQTAMGLLLRLWTPQGAWLPSVVGSDTG